MGEVNPPAWLDSPGLHAYLLGQPAQTALLVRRARHLYAQLVAAGRDRRLWEEGLNKQIYLGDDDFVARAQGQAVAASVASKEVPKAQRKMPRTWAYWLNACASREEALRSAHVHSGISMTALAAQVGLSVARVSQLIQRAESGEAALPAGSSASDAAADAASLSGPGA